MGKLEKVREAMNESGLDGMLITNPTNRRYMSGFTGSEGVLLISQHEAKIIVDFRYFSQVKDEVADFEIVESSRQLLKQTTVEANNMKIKKLGYEEDDLTCSLYRKYKESLGMIELCPVSGLVEKVRMVKTAEECQTLREAAAIADDAFNHIQGYIHEGITEKEIATEMEFYMRKKGAESSSFDMIVVSGTRTALPHGKPTDKKVEKGDMITLDFGALYQGYRSDITRTIAVGEPSDQLKEVYQIVLDAQLSCIDSIRPGMKCGEVDKGARNPIERSGYGDYFGHGTGHGIGLDIHEGPSVSGNSEEVLQPGMVITVEPGIYIPGVGGVRIEDDVLITDKGYEVLTKSSKELLIL